MNETAASVNATMSAAAQRRSATTAYPFFACMIKLALVLVGTVCLFSGGLYLGRFATTAWPGPGHWMGAEAPIDTTVLEKLKAELDLTPAQVAQMAPVITAACTNLRLVSEENRAERLALIDEMSATIAPGLSADQQRRLEAMETELQNKTPVKRDMRIVALF